MSRENKAGGSLPKEPPPKRKGGENIVDWGPVDHGELKGGTSPGENFRLEWGQRLKCGLDWEEVRTEIGCTRLSSEIPKSKNSI